MSYPFVLTIAQIVISLILITLVLLQERSAGMSGIFGGDGSGIYQTRRGLQRVALGSTIFLAILFVLVSLAQLVLG
ncbi:MAG: preprotein translocase subunit SecG [Candidatus Liptonbacteria bacterium RIFCSPHIGHO2_01_FULL_57_28]|uniref:Protein-export membrane protein SecG n=1 Tax=Candidatus Liptonbacteria bacterium RIFCSPHIGHO2_01_FULL_57_28 TaxID=1798647 RepID=A0A1G2CAG1_9BACT|nr:MAG: preprotein translocase subunit SecG [Candidatus Liptonbacteria bacterium RIFCSPHIGHO2_01_FULL_57_28]